MRILICCGATAVVAGMAAAMSGQSEIPKTSSSYSYIQTSKLVGRKVKSSQGKEIGVIKDIVIDRSDGCMAYTVVSIGGEGTGVVSGGGKIVAVPWAVYSPTSDLGVLTIKVDRDKIYNAPAFEYARIDEYARPDYVNNVYSYYGVSRRPGTAAAASSEATKGTDATGTAGATVSPGEVASPAPAATVAPNQGPSARTHAASAVTPYEVSSVDRSRKGIRSARAIRTPTTTSRREAVLPTTEESASETPTSSSENKTSRRKAIEDTSTPRPTAAPQSAEGQD